MARKYGKKVEVKIDPLAYNIGLIGESGIGKSTLIKEVCEKLAGDDGYIAFNVGKEDGHDAINGIVSQDIPDYTTFKEVTDDIIENKATDYKDLKVVIIDTFDQLMEITEPEVVRLHNKENPDKKVNSIKAAFGGFMAGEDKAIGLVLDRLWELKKVGVAFIIVGHTKKKDIEDVVTGQTYSILTTNMSQRYFNAIKTKLHFLGVASIDREIAQLKTGKKNIVTKQEEVKGHITNESRKITFRDDSFSIDSKSRFADIIDSIPLDPDEFIKAITDAIIAEHSKGDKTVEESVATEKKQAEQKAKDVKKYVEHLKDTKVDESRNTELITIIQTKFTGCSDEVKAEIKKIMSDNGFGSFRDDNIPTQALEKIVKAIG